MIFRMGEIRSVNEADNIIVDSVGGLNFALTTNGATGRNTDTFVIPNVCLEDILRMKTKVQRESPTQWVSYYEGQVTWITSNDNCQILINITTTNGIIQINVINITYDYNISTLFVRNDALSYNETINVIPNQKYKRRYSINPTSNLASNNISITGYYTRNGSPSLAEFNGQAVTVNANDYYEYVQTINISDIWSTFYVWDSNITINASINMTNISANLNGVIYENFTLFYRSANDLGSEASAGTFTNVTHSWNYNSSIGQQEKIEIYIGGTFYDITPTSIQGCPDYERQTADTRIFYTCINRTERYASVKIESSS